MIVLNYHELVRGSPSNAWCLTHETFDAHLALCGDRLVSPHIFLESCDDLKAWRTDAVLLTFDDGFLSDYTQVYARYTTTGRIPGFMSFIPVDFVGSPGRMSWEMIEELGRAGVAIGSHGMAHVDLTKVSDVELDRELTVSKSMLEDRLGQKVSLFAFPYGRFSRRVWEAALKVGYTHLFTIQLGYHRGFESFLYSRLCLTNNMDTKYMRQHLLDPEAMRGLAWGISTRLGLYRQLMRFRYR
ncbi:polysaccharide deacetylase family protein [Bradyrhizobium canariense]|uniref:polysaccharide deacetylase family protein n=1 Tax=Bradyrhizobium canariense TaxID=255045 RepID=UPI000A1958DD|nr:polysaccharide deacetylase family protein [Bradyrhizobium canariense]OSI35410.1 chitin deacetylase [Bradyrhizobium canariense]OSI39784.1 chitin deacetylase [Bradyrhizobium canariense]OSI55897.1 chitin deacetylase [Bradyrhizobium canariense]OSI57864.1 chitin deacetylase [Bradyrhizobium canariense]OSI61025.1 chitin deacetylase [Bradyrhizobium canariense]